MNFFLSIEKQYDMRFAIYFLFNLLGVFLFTFLTEGILNATDTQPNEMGNILSK